MNEDKATRYHRLKRRLSVVSLAWGLVLLLGLIVSGFSAELRLVAERWAAPFVGWPSVHSVVTRSFYLVLLALLNELIAFPLGFYGSFVVERRYGLSTETLRHWLRDHLKSVLVGGAFALAGLNLLYAAIGRWPADWWLPAGAGFAAITILIANIFPVLLLPLFYKIEPITRESLRTRLLALAARAGVRAVNAYEWRVSDRTRKANAGLTGLGRTRRIIVSDTLLNEYSDDEIEMILAHELGHHAHKDIWKGIAVESVLSLIGFYLAARLLIVLAPVTGLRGPSDIAGLPVLLLVGAAVSLVVLPAVNALSRLHERRADSYALDLGKNIPAFISAMRRLASQNLAEDDPSTLVRVLFYTHPPVRERIESASRRLRG